MTSVVLWGIYFIKPRAIGYKLAYCPHCQSNESILRIRYFGVLHLFWIPLLPLGFLKYWSCSCCHKEPVQSRKSILVLGLLLLGILVPVTVGGYRQNPKDSDGLIAMIMVLLLFAALTVYTVYRFRVDRKALPLGARILRGTPETCSFCGSAVVQAPEPHCEKCHLQIFPSDLR